MSTTQATLICIFVIFIFCRFELVTPRSYIVTFIPMLKIFDKQTDSSDSAQSFLKFQNSVLCERFIQPCFGWKGRDSACNFI